MTQFLAILGTVLGVCNTIWGIYKHYSEKAERIRAATEQLSLDISFLTSIDRRYSTLRTSIRNTGRVQVFIESVDLKLSPIEAFTPKDLTSVRAREIARTVQFVPERKFANPLHAGQSCDFVLSDPTVAGLSVIATDFAPCVPQVVVRTGSGSEFVVPAARVGILLEDIVKEVGALQRGAKAT